MGLAKSRQTPEDFVPGSAVGNLKPQQKKRLAEDIAAAGVAQEGEEDAPVAHPEEAT